MSRPFLLPTVGLYRNPRRSPSDSSRWQGQYCLETAGFKIAQVGRAVMQVCDLPGDGQSESGTAGLPEPRGPRNGFGRGDRRKAPHFVLRRHQRPLRGVGVDKCLTMTYFRRDGPDYHRRWRVSRSCSRWEGVVPRRYGRQT